MHHFSLNNQISIRSTLVKSYPSQFCTLRNPLLLNNCNIMNIHIILCPLSPNITFIPHRKSAPISRTFDFFEGIPRSQHVTKKTSLPNIKLYNLRIKCCRNKKITHHQKPPLYTEKGL